MAPSTHIQALGSVPALKGLGPRALRTLARLVEDIRVPAGTHIPGSDRQVLVLVEGTVVDSSNRRVEPCGVVRGAAVSAVTDARLLAVERRVMVTVTQLAPLLVAGIPGSGPPGTQDHREPRLRGTHWLAGKGLQQPLSLSALTSKCDAAVLRKRLEDRL